MELNRYIKHVEYTNRGLYITLINNSTHLLMDEHSKDKMLIYIKRNLLLPVQLHEGWLGGEYEKLGFYATEKDAERGLVGDQYLHELLDEFKGKKVRITIAEIL